MRVALGSDHAGFELKNHLASILSDSGYTVFDLGTHTADSVDYPDFAAAVGKAVIDGRADRGIVICGSGAGASVAANKIKGVRAVVAHDTYTAHQSVEHDDVGQRALDRHQGLLAVVGDGGAEVREQVELLAQRQKPGLAADLDRDILVAVAADGAELNPVSPVSWNRTVLVEDIQIDIGPNEHAAEITV